MYKPSIILLVLALIPGLIFCVSCSDDSEDHSIATIEPNTSYEEIGIANSEAISSTPEFKTMSSKSPDVTRTNDRMIVRTGNLKLKVQDIAQTLNEIKEIAESYSGYVVSSDWYGDKSENNASISVRVPADQYYALIEAVREFATEVLFESTQSKDVTEEYTDLKAELTNLETTESRYLALLENAETVEEMLDIEDMISKTRGEIEKTTGRMLYLERTSATSLIMIELVEESELKAAFTTNTIEIKQGGQIWFTNETTGGSPPYGYHWEFGDGEINTDENPQLHKYDKSGKYTISLTVTDSKGNTDMTTKTDYITVVAKPGWSARNIAESAWHGLVDFGHFFSYLIIWIGVFSIIWLPALLIAVWIKRHKAM